MQDATINDIHHHIAKLENRRARMVAVHGRPGRGGRVVDSTDAIARVDEQLADWRALLAFAENN